MNTPKTYYQSQEDNNGAELIFSVLRLVKNLKLIREGSRRAM